MENKPLELVVLMAGEGQRFVKAGFKTPKPFVEVKGKTILDWTLSSAEPLIKGNLLSFAIRAEHELKYNIVEKLKEIYGQGSRFYKFEKTTRGSLETAYISAQSLLSVKNHPVAFLDSDNKYDVVNLQSLLREIPEKDFAVLCYFKLQDKTDLKWSFCSVDPKTNRVSEVKEKVFFENGQPLIGFFYWSSVEFFEKVAKEVLTNEPPGKNNEYYMSQAINYALKENFPVYAFESTHMVALGTPEDVEKFSKV